MFDELLTNGIRKLVQHEMEKYNLDLACLQAEILDLKTKLENKASTQTRTAEELTEFIVSAVRNEMDIEEFIDERIELALDNSEFIKSDALEDALESKFDSATIEIRF